MASQGTTAVDVAAAADLGSNSFHLIVARMLPGEILVIDRMRERVQLAAGLGANRDVSEEAQQRAILCLERFGSHLSSLPAGHVRAVGTHTFRRARNSRALITRAEKALGHPIEVISGQEEARLIFLGVAHSQAPIEGPRLVVDIGGGSTELMLGEGTELSAGESLQLGCVSFSRRFFGDGLCTARSFESAVIAARLELQRVVPSFDPPSWLQCLGSSGTINAIQRIGEAQGWSGTEITADSLARLTEVLLDIRQLAELSLPGLKRDRASVLPGGLAVLTAVFESFELESMAPASGGLREGLLYDLHGRFEHRDIRERTIHSFSRRFYIDEDQARRVERTARGFFAQAKSAWGFEYLPHASLLEWAARLHEIGLSVSHLGHHKHGEYLLLHSDMAGFSFDDQRVLAALVRCHRKKVLPALFDDTPLSGKKGLRLVILLRLAVLLNRSRSPEALPELTLELGPDSLSVGFPSGWLDGRPLIAADLEREAATLASVGYTLRVSLAGVGEEFQ